MKIKIGTPVEFKMLFDDEGNVRPYYGRIEEVLLFNQVLIRTMCGNSSRRNIMQVRTLTEAEYWLHILER